MNSDLDLKNFIGAAMPKLNLLEKDSGRSDPLCDY